MNKIIEVAGEMLTNGEVQLVIGYEKGSNGNGRPAFIDSPEACNKLIFDGSCKINLAVYLTKKHIKQKGKIAVIAQKATLASIVTLYTENQIAIENIVALTFDANSNVVKLRNIDEIIEFLKAIGKSPDELDSKIEEIEKMSIEERWNFWQEQFSKCFKCYACRAACPLCYCEKCTVDQNQPQWIQVPATKTGNLEWHIMRAMHLAGRCSNCNACSNACPQGIPLNLLTRKLSQDIFKEFKYEPGTAVHQTYALSDFNIKDKENFIK